MNEAPRSPCPLCGEMGRYGREQLGSDTYYVVDCPSCRQLRIPSTFFTLLWDTKEPERRAIGRLLLERRGHYGPSLLLNQDQYRSLMEVLATSSGRWLLEATNGSGGAGGNGNRITPANGITKPASHLDQKLPSRKA